MILDRLETGLTRLEGFLVETVAKVGPWISPLPRTESTLDGCRFFRASSFCSR